jgi:hypothetical protein
MCRPIRCLKALFTRADTAPTELSIAMFLTVYGLRMHIGGVGYWDTSEYALVVGQLGISPVVWPLVILAMGVAQFASLFSSYPNTMWSRVLRIITSGLTTLVLTFLALAQWLQNAHEPSWLAFAGIAAGGMWIFIRTQGVRGGH